MIFHWLNTVALKGAASKRDFETILLRRRFWKEMPEAFIQSIVRDEKNSIDDLKRLVLAVESQKALMAHLFETSHRYNLQTARMESAIAITEMANNLWRQIGTLDASRSQDLLSALEMMYLGAICANPFYIGAYIPLIHLYKTIGATNEARFWADRAKSLPEELDAAQRDNRDFNAFITPEMLDEMLSDLDA